MFPSRNPHIPATGRSATPRAVTSDADKPLRTRLALAGVWMVCTLINVGKAAHIDDAAHLEIARWIAEHPLHPMQGIVQWGEHAEPIHHLNQPHLFFYLLALVRVLVGPSLIAAQLLVSLFVALGIASFHHLWRVLVGMRGSVLGPALLFLGPAFIPGQNIMTDAPLLALWCAFAASLVHARGAHVARGLWLAALLASMACLVKYTSLVLLPVLALDIALRGREGRRHAVVLVFPVLALAAWSAFNFVDYGGIHLVERPIATANFTALEALGITLGRAALWVVTLGATLPFFIAMIPALREDTRWRRGGLIGLVAVVLLTIATQLVATQIEPLRGEAILVSLMRSLSFVVGIAAFVLFGGAMRTRKHASVDDARAITVLGALFIITTLFVVVLSPFVAVRHVLLVLPLWMPLVARTRLNALSTPSARPFLVAATALTALLGVFLGVSDRRWAERYRSVAEAEGALEGRTYFVGHWGWQWHASEAGLLPYEPDVTPLEAGDRLVRPRLVDQPGFTDSDRARMQLQRTVAEPATPFDFLRTTTERPGYYAVWQGLPYTVSLAPSEVFEVYEVVR